MKYENRFKDIQMVIEEQIEVEEYELKGNGEPQFRVTIINGESVADVTNKLLRGTGLDEIINSLKDAKVKQ